MVTGSQAAQRRERILTAAIRQRLIDPDDALLAGFVDLDGVADSVAALQQAFPGSVSVLHAFAAKANPLVPLLEELRGLGMGCEVASAGELGQALAAGFAPEQIVFDSPAKTPAELRQALELGVAVNADNFQELDRIGNLLATCSLTSQIGVRINPQVGAGSIAASSTATATSKVRHRAGGRRQHAAAAAGLPGASLADLGARARRITGLPARPDRRGHREDGRVRRQGQRRTRPATDHRHRHRRRTSGRLRHRQHDPRLRHLRAHLRDHAPALFTGAYRIVTEFGHSLLSKNGFTAAYVEYAKTSGGRPIAITHAGAQVATRTVFQPDSWPLRVTAHHPTGARKTGPLVAQDIAGPLCFAGDVIARARRLPALVPGDVVTILDTGAYCFSAPYHFNTLPEPAVYGVRTGPRGDVRFELLRSVQTIDDILT